MIGPRDLLVVGGLALDRFPDGSGAPGGSVVHAARALAFAGLRGATITVAGPEPQAEAALTELRALGPLLVQAAPWSISFTIDERPARRVVTYEAGARLPITAADVAATPARALLLAPIAGELDGADLGATSAVRVRVAALQGWLRGLVPGEPVRPRPLSVLPGELRDLTALIASDEDLGLEAAAGADALRAWAGAGPIIVVTAGRAGAALDLPDGSRVAIPVAAPVDQVPTVGAGDAFAALFAAALGRGDEAAAAARNAASGVSRWLASRA